ncbi:head GIN domain-containing protein [Robertkochia flava]|uniref:head GIN domain-containing protein n=1 Tax=Robertkochia flava TaxID=3447986 RepID=UPI001CCF44C2|nr:head GIN domain-containing protein [Robertkochia marina]
MKKVLTYIVMLLIGIPISGCDSGGDCFRGAGDRIMEEITVDSFNELFVNEDIEVVVTQGAQYKVVVETGERLFDDFKAEVTEGVLTLTMENTCEILRAYNETKVWITAPDITRIVSSTQYAIRSEGILDFNNLSLLSDGFTLEGSVTNGEFILEVEVDRLSILANELANFEISGRANSLHMNLADGSVRAYMPELYVGYANIYHRSSNDVTLFPVDSVRGELWGTGNLVLVNVPPVIEVKENYKGKLILD